MCALARQAPSSEKPVDRFRSLLEKFQEILGFDTASVLRASEDRSFFTIRAAIGLEEEISGRVQIPFARSIAGKIASSGRPYLAEKLDFQELRSPALRDNGIRSLIAVPIFNTQGPNVIGVLQAGFLKPRRFEAWHVALMEIIAENISNAMDQSELLKTSEANAEALRCERELRDRLVAALGHDLRGPLSAAKMNAEMIAKHPDRLDLEAHLLKRILSSVDRADRMIQDLLDAARIKTGQPLALAIRSCQLDRVIQSAVEQLQDVHGDRFIFKAPRGISGFWNAEGIQRIIGSLCDNAIKFGAPDTPVLISIDPGQTQVHVSVHNSGDPIRPEETDALFYQGPKRPPVRSCSGWGLGLALVKGITEAHGGSISLDTGSRGTTFTIHLPRDSRPFMISQEP